MLDIIQNNPYRLLGIYSNSPTKERVANHNRLKAFLKVGRDMSFALDLPVLLPAIIRSTEIITEADTKLTLPNEQLRYAQFWFLKSTPLDDIAMNHLAIGNMDGAISIWEKKDNASSLQNRIVCALIQDNYTVALACAEKLYSSHITDFINIVLGEYHTANTEEPEYCFLDELCSALGAKELLSYLQKSDWKQYIKDKIIKPLIGTLQSAIDIAKASKGKGVSARYNAGVKLANETRAALMQLKSLLSDTDLQYQVVADKLGLEILQCGIDYYNGSEAADAAHKAMKLQSYALSIVVGKMAKERCKENVDILKNIIENLPPIEVFAEDKTIQEELKKFCKLPDKISHALTLLNNTKPHLQSIKAKLGTSNSYYLKLSTQVVGNALHNIIEEVNALQKDETVEIGGKQIPISMLFDRETKISQIKSALRSAWNAIEIMDTFDMESDFKINSYNQNRSILKELCDQLNVFNAGTFRISSIPKSNAERHPPMTDILTSSNGNRGNSSITNHGYSGCITGIVCVVISAIIGGIIAGVGGFVFGMLLGICIYGKIND